jgi:CheY-like chemotaxis protein
VEHLPRITSSIGACEPYDVPRRVACVHGHERFEVEIAGLFADGVFLALPESTLAYSDPVELTFLTEKTPRLSFRGQVATWVRRRGVRVEVLPDTPVELTAALAAWSRAQPAAVPKRFMAQALGIERLLPLAGRRALVVDDDPGVLRGLRRILERLGCEVSAVAHPPQALDQVSRETFDVVLLDWLLPAVPGQVFLETVRDLAPGVPVAVMSGGLFWDGAADDLRARGASAVFEKPIDVDRLRKWLVRRVGAARSALGLSGSASGTASARSG